MLIDIEGRVILSFGDQYAFCGEYLLMANPSMSCAQEHSRAGQMAREFAESYVFSCHSGLNHVVYPILVKGKQFGSVLAGPFLMEALDESFVEDVESRGADPSIVLDLNQQLISSIAGSRSLYDICYRLQDNIEIFTDNLFQTTERSSRIVKNALDYVSRHFSEEITLTSVAEELHVNTSYLSMLFRQVTGMTFKEHLNRVRVEEAELLLTNTDYAIIEIAIAYGYRDQSYFTKVFKKYTGLTPRQYR